MTASSGRLAAGAIEIAYEERGGGERPLVLVHGFAGSRDDFADVIDPLSEAGRTVALDQRGHGESSNPGSGYGLDQLVRDLTGFLDAAGIARCDVLGHSLGGMVALRLALAHPERVASLVLMDTAARSTSPMPLWALRAVGVVARVLPPTWLWRMTRAGRRRLPEPMRRAEREMGRERYWERLRVKLVAMDKAAYGEGLREIVGQVSLLPRLSEIACPTLVMVGAEDLAFHETSRELADGIPDAKLIVVPDAHHSPQIEAREAFLAGVRDHLSRARG